MLHVGALKRLLLDLLADSSIVREAIIDDVRDLVHAGEEVLGFELLCSWLFEDDLAITQAYYGRLVAAAEELDAPEPIRRLDELIRVSDRFEAELARHDWPALDSYGDAADLPEALRALAAARTVVDRVDQIVFADGFRFPAATTVASVLAHSLEVFSPTARPHALNLLTKRCPVSVQRSRSVGVRSCRCRAGVAGCWGTI
ncbi:MafI family immunity protein [Glycomyces sp. A-F 0318]|uniref:MafI family immunity protein n=1 Tax=Glycomyces amatae TaxID=2881355 RepID=UPI001E5C9D1F|nr:MafI family immunity protein [Glycomyces amatae]MCD0446386.1 MafI family immunity protein [Glycomyces amatae]